MPNLSSTVTAAALSALPMRLTPNFLPLRSSTRLIWSVTKEHRKTIDRSGDQHGSRASQVAGDHGGSAGVHDRRFAADQGRDGERRADQQHQFNIKAVLGVKPHVLGCPHVQLRGRDHCVSDAQFFHCARRLRLGRRAN